MAQLPGQPAGLCDEVFSSIAQDIAGPAKRRLVSFWEFIRILVSICVAFFLLQAINVLKTILFEE